MLVALKPQQRARQARAVIWRGCASDANVVPGMEIFFQPIQNINLGGKLSKSQYQYTLQSNDTETLYRSRPSCATRSRRFPACSTSPPTSTSRTRR